MLYKETVCFISGDWSSLWLLLLLLSLFRLKIHKQWYYSITYVASEVGWAGVN